MNEKRKNEDDTHCSKRGRKSDDEKPLVRWADLPSIAVEKIYTYLNREEQCRMSMVCRNWNTVYLAPSLWRKVEFLIPEQHLNLEVYPEVLFARKYGYMFHHVEIVWNVEVQRSHRDLIWKQIKLFLEALANYSTLETVKFLHMKRHLLYMALENDVHQTIKNFFLSQHQLKTVEIRGVIFQDSEVAKILRVIFHKNSKSLQNLCLLNDLATIHGDDEITENVGNEAIFESFLNIKTLQLNYHPFFENIMIASHEYIQNSGRTRGNLELIEIDVCCYDDYDSFRGIPPECWKLLSKICPSLRINLNLLIVYDEGEIRNIIDLFVCPTMPVKVLKIEFDYQMMIEDDSAETQIGDLFRHLQTCVSNECLEDLRIVWPIKSSLAIDVTGVLQTFQKLRNLDISTEEEPFDENPNAFRTLFITESNNVRVTWRN